MKDIFGTDPTTWVVLVSMLLLRFMLVLLGNAFTVLNHYSAQD